MNLTALKRLKQVEIFGLYALAFVLPIMESPKHFALGILFLGTLGHRLMERPISWRRPDFFEWLLLAIWGISLASTVANWPFPNGIKGLKSTSCMLFLFWAMYRGAYDRRQLKGFLWALIAGVVIGLIWGLWEWQHGIRIQLEFHSAGIVTQSAAYLGIAILVMVGIVLDNTSRFSLKPRILTAACLAFTLVCLILMGSRGAILGVLVALCLLIPNLYRMYGGRVLFIGLAAAIAVAGTAVIVSAPSKKLMKRVSHLVSNFSLDTSRWNKNDHFRLDHWVVGYAQATQGGHVLLGIGPKNFTSVQVEKLELSRPLVTYPKIWTIPEHAHNLFLTKWVEEGLLGLIAFVLFLGAVAWHLFATRPKGGNISWPWIAALGALVIPLVAGSFNSSFENEFAWLAMMLMGLGMNEARKETD